MKYVLKPLSYSYDALEPYIDARTMEIHHSKHYQGYVDKLNETLLKVPQLLEKDLEELLKNPNVVPAEIRQDVINYGGGVYNHELFWLNMSPNGLRKPAEPLNAAILKAFGSYENWWGKFALAAKGKFGSGWVWLVKDKDRNLSIVATSNQDSPLALGFYPLLGIDVWEHAYYLKYQNRRAEYVDTWINVIDWQEALRRFQQA
jgi:Fe-Mn family superoxide dismutase